MLTITVMGDELFDDDKQEFIQLEAVTFDIEHSLVSLSKWEAIWEKPFLGQEAKTSEETLSYVECMCLTPDVDSDVFKRLSDSNVKAVNEYISKKMTATWFNERNTSGPHRKEVITAEIIYYWMIAQNIPIECETWHLNRLLTLVKVVSEKSAPKKKMGRREAAQQQRLLNQQRQSQYNTRG